MDDKFVVVDDLPVLVGELVHALDPNIATVYASREMSGRNPWWIVETASQTLFVKQIVGVDEDIARRLAAVRIYEEHHRTRNRQEVRSPRLLASSDAGVVVFEYVDQSAQRNLGKEIRDFMLRPGDVSSLGGFLAILHSGALRSERARPFGEISKAFDALPMDGFTRASAGELEVWRLLQNDIELREAVTALAKATAEAPLVDGHGDLRVDQVLSDQGAWLICDWEEYSLIDPARDLGVFAGDILCAALLGSREEFARRLDDPWEEADVSLEFARRIEYVLPLLAALLDSYGRGGHLNDDFAERASAFVGWHLLERMIAAGTLSARVSGLAKGVGGIGRSILLDPRHFFELVRGSTA